MFQSSKVEKYAESSKSFQSSISKIIRKKNESSNEVWKEPSKLSKCHIGQTTKRYLHTIWILPWATTV
jgi:hypothetical protein